MANLLRGEIYWADLHPVRGSEQSGLRKSGQSPLTGPEKKAGEVDAVELSQIIDGLTN